MISRVALGISGGVDSAVAAVLLKNKGFDVAGVFMKNWDIADEMGRCTADEDFKDASYVCKQLDIKLYQVNFVKEYWNEVFSNLIKEYENGWTPNPDILCNKNIKFNYFYKFARDHLKADAIATGHYARTSFGPYLEHFNLDKAVRLLRAADLQKDQTFFLSQIGQEALKRTMFPLGDLMKWEVKHMAEECNLENIALKRESMGICFIGSRNFQTFITEYIQNKPGPLIDIDTGTVVGEHSGLHQWTIGQRTRIPGLSKAYFICRKDVKDNVIYVARGTKHPSLHSDLFFTLPPHWIYSEPVQFQKDAILRCEFKFQHTHDVVPCKVCKTSRGLVVQLYQPKRALTPGQFAVFYRDGECLGSARIWSPGSSNFALDYLQYGHLNRAKDILNTASEDVNESSKDKIAHAQ